MSLAISDSSLFGFFVLIYYLATFKYLLMFNQILPSPITNTMIISLIADKSHQFYCYINLKPA